jgi:cytochrome P450
MASAAPRIDPTNPVPPTGIIRRFGRDQVPDHVPPELVFETGLTYGPEFLANPHKMMAEMHEKLPPVYYNVGMFGNMWSVTKHEDALFMLRHAEIFSNEDATPFPRDPNNWFYFIPIELDPPDHRKYRNIVDPYVSPQAVLKLEDRIRALANELIDDFIDKGECRFDEAFGRPLPVLVFLDLMGLPRDMCDTFVSWAMALLHSNDRQIMGDTLKTICDYLSGAIAEKQANPDEGLVSKIANAEIDGRPISEREAHGFVVFLFIAGLDTVFATLNLIWTWLANNPDRRKEIIDNPDKINAVVEELLRVHSTTFSGRTVAQDVELRGVKLKKGDKITSILPACNFDPDVFPNPTEVDFNRPKKIILAFTVGVHSCMGAHLARLEVKVALQEWLRRIPDFKLPNGYKPEYRPGGVIGPEEVPLRWDVK